MNAVEAQRLSGDERRTQPEAPDATRALLRAGAKAGAMAIRARRRLSGESADEPLNWWQLPLPKKAVARAWYGSIPGRVGSIYEAPGWMSPPERLALYALVYGLRPKRCLEIGTFYGGSAMIIVAALDDIGAGSLDCVDPDPRISQRHRRRIEHRATVHAVRSPEGVAPLAPTKDDHFDLVLIDGDHSYESAVSDFEGVRGVLADDAVVLFHDAHYYEVERAIVAMLARYASQLIDCGMVSTLPSPANETGEDGRPIVWGGFRMLRWSKPIG